MTKYIIAVAVGAVLASFSSQAATKFKDSSVLSSGKWVKIKVGETGVYEITGEQLKQFGFSDPQKVKIFGTGGIQTTDNYNKDYTDDLEQVPAMRTGDKLYFYANGLTYEEIRSIDYTTNFDIYHQSQNASPHTLPTSLRTRIFDARDGQNRRHQRKQSCLRQGMALERRGVDLAQERHRKPYPLRQTFPRRRFLKH